MELGPQELGFIGAGRSYEDLRTRPSSVLGHLPQWFPGLLPHGVLLSLYLEHLPTLREQPGTFPLRLI